ncbi:C4-dicarboxylate TRAP transporter substrate-binding protein [Microbacterium sp. zg.Y625]|uniref:C4-dicarboxylate TRAP transporter substrate-binding protein n=1 Tax=Microbacterium jiangjiandongii TaxID=3049071 RepID=UPI00214C57D5|nr:MULTISPECIES: C4-dicarboxylate TRAP transporter substrate-binding protein [unclassified Microbacterium]MCR2793482.1 C4-dicarboxylate TRAP transporter substrate-binding protein [Microbacterium sp. zg.Y625]MCR2815340.1 C4-dicarboxylate TRAP transporter substrate-binding protein [Microbacterium sp. zg.Y843]WIM25151.1 C4-dicarboxylate TRAP transporter substrate-binding protein [Microbacterium sp. zg-Y625]
MTGVTAIVAVGALTACAGTSGGGEEVGSAEAWLDELEPRVLKLADFSGDQTANFGAAMVEWEEAITEFTDGKITFENYWSSSLLNATDTLPGVRDGVADIGLIIATTYPQELPVGTWLSGLGGALSGSTVHDVAAGGAASLENSWTFDALTDEYAANNLKILQSTSTPAYNLLCTKPIDSLADAAGALTRSSGEVWTNTAEALGMTTVSLPFNEAYEGLQRGVIDCMIINPNQYVSGLILKDVAPEYVPVTFAQLQASTWVINLDVWESFPPELQDFITEESARTAYKIWQGYLDIEAGAGEVIAAGEEVRTHDVSELEDMAAAQRAKALEGMAESAPAAVSDPQAVIDEYRERVQYWTDALTEEGYEVTARDPDAILEAFAGLRDVDLSGYYEKFESEFVQSQLK